MTVLSDGKKSETDCFINTVSIGRRFAGGFFLTPEAVANDGLLDVCSIKRLSLLQRLRILMMVPKGTHIRDKKVNYYKTERLSMEFEEKVPFHVDGELYFSDRFEISLLPCALKIIYNPAGNHYFKTITE
jgi:diacylglycerol kinase (ATP)